LLQESTIHRQSPETRFSSKTLVPMACAVPRKHGFDQWLEQVLGSQQESFLAQFQQLISKRLELHHAELIAQVEMQLAMPSSQDVQVMTEDVPQERAEDELGPQPDTRMQTACRLHTKYAPSEDLVADVTWSHIGALGISDQQGNNGSRSPGRGIPSASFRTADQNTNTSIIPSGSTEVDSAPIKNSCPALPKEMMAGFLDARPDNSPGHKSPFSIGDKSPLRRKLSYKNQRLAALASQGTENMEGADFWLRLVNSQWFESFVVVVILLNCMTLVLEAQYVGYNVGHSLGYRNYDTSASERFPWVNSTVHVAQFIFNTIFLIELLLRVGAYRQNLCRYPVIACDMLLVMMSAADLIVAGFFGGTNPAAIRCIRMLKLFKMMKVLRNRSWMSSLFLIVRSITACVNALLWSLTLLALLQTCVGLGLFQVLHKFLEDSSKDLKSRKLVFEYFGTFGRTIVTMYEISVGNWAPVCRLLMEEVSEWFGLFFRPVQLYIVLCCCQCAQGSVHCRDWKDSC